MPCFHRLSFISYLLPLTFYLLPLTSYLLPLTSYLLPLTFYLLPFTFYLLPFIWFSHIFTLQFYVTLSPVKKNTHLWQPNTHLMSRQLTLWQPNITSSERKSLKLSSVRMK